ncbi:DUF1178 family protein [Yoonia sp. MH D7]
MIKFTLSCDKTHSFTSWFKSNDACDTLLSKGMVECTTCGSNTIRKTLMTPSVATKSGPTEIEKLKNEIETKSEYVGTKFALRAREMNSGTTPQKPIYGEATAAEARALIKDGIPVLPLPFIPTKKLH